MFYASIFCPTKETCLSTDQLKFVILEYAFKMISKWGIIKGSGLDTSFMRCIFKCDIQNPLVVSVNKIKTY